MHSHSHGVRIQGDFPLSLAVSVLTTKVLEYAAKYLAKSTMRQLIKRIFAVGAMSLALARRATATTQEQQQQEQQQPEDEQAARKNWVFNDCGAITALEEEGITLIGGGLVMFTGIIDCEAVAVSIKVVQQHSERDLEGFGSLRARERVGCSTHLSKEHRPRPSLLSEDAELV